MPEAAANLEEANMKENTKSKEGNEKKLKKSATSNGLGSFTRGKLVLARINMLDGTVSDLSIEVSICYQSINSVRHILDRLALFTWRNAETLLVYLSIACYLNFAASGLYVG